MPEVEKKLPVGVTPRGDKVYQEIRTVIQVQEREKKRNWEKGQVSEKLNVTTKYASKYLKNVNTNYLLN